MSYQQLILECEQIDSAVARLRRLTEAREPNVSAVLCALFNLAAEVSRHLAHEDNFIYPKMIKGSVGEMSSVAQRFVDQFSSIRSDWNAYLIEWPPDRIKDDWGEFGLATKVVTDRLSMRITAESAVIYSMALNHSLIRLLN